MAVLPKNATVTPLARNHLCVTSTPVNALARKMSDTGNVINVCQDTGDSPQMVVNPAIAITVDLWNFSAEIQTVNAIARKKPTEDSAMNANQDTLIFPNVILVNVMVTLPLATQRRANVSTAENTLMASTAKYV